MSNWGTQLKEQFRQQLPGKEAQLMMSPRMRRPAATDLPLKKSGVLILLYPHEGSTFTVFIKRTEYNGIHSGQISLPGGMFKESDISLSNTALREAKEETGIAIDEVSVIGQLTCLHIPVSNVNVFPFVAVGERRPEFNPDPTEVQYLIETRLDELSNPLNRKNKIMQIASEAINVPYFDIKENHIWGATAMIMSEFLEIYKSVNRDW